jgi:hypothetical protein
MMTKYAGPTPPYPMADDHADIDDSEWAAAAEDEDALHPALHVSPPAGLIDMDEGASMAAQFTTAEREWADFVRSEPGYDGVDLRGFKRTEAHWLHRNLNQTILTIGILTLTITGIYSLSWQGGIGLGLGLGLIIVGLTGAIEDAANRARGRR